jgi:hypothetical protein
MGCNGILLARTGFSFAVYYDILWFYYSPPPQIAPAIIPATNAWQCAIFKL